MIQTLRIWPVFAMKTLGNGCLKILTNGSVILMIPEHTFSWVMQVLAKVLLQEPWHSVKGILNIWPLLTFAVIKIEEEIIPRVFLQLLTVISCKCSSEYSSIVGGEECVRKLITNSEFNLEAHELFAKLLEEPSAKCRSPPNRRLVIIDALDEREYRSRKDFLNIIKVCFPRLPDWLVFFITSRPEDQIQSRLSRYKPCIKMCAAITDRGSFYQQQEKDIQRFLEKEIDFSHLPFSVKDVTKKCGGLFLYAFCVVQELKDSAHSGEVTQLSQLNDFPDDISEFFLKNFQRVFDKVGHDLYTKLLGCIMAAPSPLPVSFIAFVLKRENSVSLKSMMS